MPVDTESKTLLCKRIGEFLELPRDRFCRKLMCVVPPLLPDPELIYQSLGPNLVFLLSGSQRTVFRDRDGRREYVQRPGEVLYLARNIHYTSFWDSHCQRLGITISPSKFFVSWNENQGQGRYVKVPDIYWGENYVERFDYVELFAALESRVRQYELNDEISITIPRLLLHVVTEMLGGNLKRDKTDDPLFRRVRSYINANYAQALTGKLLAERFRISEGHLSRCFTREAGVGIGAYIRSVRMKHAYRMLHEQTAGVEKTAHDCGFPDPSYFVKVFQAYWGITPGDLRRHRAKESSSTPLITHLQSATSKD